MKKGYEDASQTINISPEEEKFLEIQMYLSKTEEKSDDSYVNNKPYKNRDETKNQKFNFMKQALRFTLVYSLYLIILGVLPPT